MDTDWGSEVSEAITDSTRVNKIESKIQRDMVECKRRMTEAQEARMFAQIINSALPCVKREMKDDGDEHWADNVGARLLQAINFQSYSGEAEDSDDDLEALAEYKERRNRIIFETRERMTRGGVLPLATIMNADPFHSASSSYDLNNSFSQGGGGDDESGSGGNDIHVLPPNLRFTILPPLDDDHDHDDSEEEVK